MGLKIDKLRLIEGFCAAESRLRSGGSVDRFNSLLLEGFGKVELFAVDVH